MQTISGKKITDHQQMSDIQKNLYIRLMALIGLVLLSISIVTVFQPDIPPGLLGYRLFKVSGVSMEPTIENGSVLIVKQTDPALIEKNDVITYLCYRGHQACTTHRVVGIEKIGEGKRQFITKGDGNPVKDPVPIPQNQVVGVVKYVFAPTGILSVGRIQQILIFTGLTLFIACFRYIDNRKYTETIA